MHVDAVPLLYQNQSNPTLRLLFLMEFNFNDRHCLKLHCYVWQPEKALVDHDDSVVVRTPSPPLRIHIDFVGQVFHRWLTHDGRRAEITMEVEHPTAVLSECVDARTFVDSYDESSEYVVEKLSQLGIHPRVHGPIAEEVIAWGRRVGTENVGPKKIVPLRVEIVTVDLYVEETESIESMVMRQSRTEYESRNDGNCGMIPASEWSVRELKRKRVEEREGPIYCTVCLKEVPRGLEVTAMPCSHLFHHDCINTWLKTSHFCPLCRFEMPID